MKEKHNLLWEFALKSADQNIIRKFELNIEHNKEILIALREHNSLKSVSCRSICLLANLCWCSIYMYIFICIYLIRYTSRHWLKLFLYRCVLYLIQMIQSVFVFVVVIALFLYNVHKHNFYLFPANGLLFAVSVSLYANIVVSLYYLHSAMCQSVTYTLTYNCAPCVKTLSEVARIALLKFETEKNSKQKPNFWNNWTLLLDVEHCKSKCFALCTNYVYQIHRLSIWRSVTQSLKICLTFLFPQTIKHKFLRSFDWKCWIFSLLIYVRVCVWIETMKLQQ